MESLSRTTVLIAALLVLQLRVSAAAQAPVEQDFFADTPLILTASRLSKPLLESPASVSVIDRQTIESAGVRELADLFRLVPGFVVGYHSGHAPAVSYHGLGQEFGRQIQVLIDGRSVFIPSYGGVPWSNLPLLLEDIERIEVIRGPNAATYGANAFLATVNIITRHAAEDRGLRYSVTSSDNANPDIEDAYLRLGQHSDDIDWRLSLGTLNDEGFAAINDSKRVARLNFRLDAATGDRQSLTFLGGISDSVLGRGFPDSEDTTTDIERDEEASNGYVNLSWERSWDSSSTLVRLAHTRQRVVDNYDPGVFEFNGFSGVTTFIDFDRDSRRTDLEVAHTDDITDRLRLVYGGSLREDRVRSVFLLNSDRFQQVDTARLFSAIEWRPGEDWLLDLGLMLEDSDLTSRETSGRVSLIRSFGGQHALRFVFSTARRNPILWEARGETEFVAEIPPFGSVVVPTWVGNENVEPERIRAFEIGLRSRTADGLESDVKLFRYEIRDHIVQPEIAIDAGPVVGVIPVGTSANGERTDVSGIEAELGYRHGGGLDIRTGFSLLDAESTLEDFEDSFVDYTAFASLVYRVDTRQEFSAVYSYLDAISWLDSSADIPAARRLDLRYAYRFGDRYRVELIGRNLLEDYADYEPENVHDQVVYLRFSGGL